jgi:hypothetical protein
VKGLFLCGLPVFVSIAVAVAQRLRWWEAVIVSTLTVVVVGFVMVIFIR